MLGEVDPRFAENFKDELGVWWELTDECYNTHRVRYSRSMVTPMLIDGWSQLRSFYSLTDNHLVRVLYMGLNKFKINVLVVPVQPFSFPLFHSLTSKPKPKRKRFQVRLTPCMVSSYQLVWVK